MPEAWGTPWNKPTKLTDVQVKFLDWLCGGRPEGESQAEFGRRYGVGEARLSQWKKSPLFVAEWEHRMRTGAANPQILGDQLQVLHAKAMSGDVRAIELYWKLVDRMTPQRVELSDVRDVADLSDEELAAAAENVLRLRQKAG